jgi:predicted NBD/HSP70 family sugar kinase
MNQAPPEKPEGAPDAAPTKILAVDIGGTKIKMLASDATEPRKLPSGKTLTPARMVEAIKELDEGWDYEAVSIGYPGLVGPNGPRSEPRNLGSGWVGFNFGAAFDKPVRIVNDAAMQALGSYDGGRMLFLGLGTGVGSALIAEKCIVTLELGQLLYKDGRTLGEVLGRRGLEKSGKTRWREAVDEVVHRLMSAFVADHVVIGGGNAKLIKKLPAGARLGHNLTAFRGGFRLWHVEDIKTLEPEGVPPKPAKEPEDWRML